MKKTFLFLGITLALVSCNEKQKSAYDIKKAETIEAPSKAEASSVQQKEDGYTLMKNNCYVCHNPKAKSHDDIIAPPFKAVKMHYMNANDSREDFINAVVKWVSNPNEDNALMPGAVNRFKVMPPLPLDEESLTKIAAYLYDNDVEEPVWMNEHMKEMKGKGKMGRGKGMGMRTGK